MGPAPAGLPHRFASASRARALVAVLLLVTSACGGVPPGPAAPTAAGQGVRTASHVPGATATPIPAAAPTLPSAGLEVLKLVQVIRG
jgi:hypothetical protein